MPEYKLTKPTLSNIKLVSSLKQGKYRRMYKLSIAEGIRLVEEALNASIPLHSAYVTSEVSDINPEIVERLLKKDCPVYHCAPSEMERISTLKTPPGCLLVYQTYFQPKEREGNLTLGLFRISDPGNLGSILRTADWFGVSKVLLSKESAELHHPGTVRGSMGAVFRLPVIAEVDLMEEINELVNQGYKLVVSQTRGGCKPFAVEGKILLILGDELGALPAEIAEAADFHFTIPRIGGGESLNLASACSILLYALTNENDSRK